MLKNKLINLKKVAVATIIAGSVFFGGGAFASSDVVEVNASNSQVRTVNVETSFAKSDVVSEVSYDMLVESKNEKGLSKPTSSWNLSSKGRYSFSGLAEGTSTLMSNYLFTGKTSMKIKATNHKSNDTLKVKLIKDSGLFPTVSTVTVPKSGTTTWTVTGLDKSAKYYLNFGGPSNFSGWIE